MNIISITAYLLYLLAVLLVTIHVGWQLYKHGEVYLYQVFENEKHLVKSINKLLLLGYYLINIGFAIYAIRHWEQVRYLDKMLWYVAQKIGNIILTLSVMHYVNIFSFYLYQLMNNNKKINI